MADITANEARQAAKIYNEHAASRVLAVAMTSTGGGWAASPGESHPYKSTYKTLPVFSN